MISPRNPRRRTSDGAGSAGIVAAGTILKAVPEGDTIHYAANKIRPVLEGRVPDASRPRTGASPATAAGATRRPGRHDVDAHGKHLFIRFENALVIHSHLRMTGKWRRARRGGAGAAHTWLVIRIAESSSSRSTAPCWS